MASYTGYTAAEYAPDAPATSDHFKRWFENWEAGFEGAVGAPRLLDAALDATATGAGRDWILKRLALVSDAGGLGTVMFAHNEGITAATIAAGSAVFGSSLSPCAADGSRSGTNMAGSWRSLGVHKTGPTGGGSPLPLGHPSRCTLFLRVL